jgi:predicted RNA-binding Zn ribbon-like protein
MLWIDLVNSLARDPLGQQPPDDRLDDPSWRDKLLSRHDLRPIPDAGWNLDELKALRTLLSRIAVSVAAGRGVRDHDLADLNQALGAAPVTAAIERDADAFTTSLSPGPDPRAGLRFAVAHSCAEFLATADLSRLRLCENPDCAWVFYDNSRSRTRRWCADSCGNLIKVRRFREKHRDD